MSTSAPPAYILKMLNKPTAESVSIHDANANKIQPLQTDISSCDESSKEDDCSGYEVEISCNEGNSDSEDDCGSQAHNMNRDEGAIIHNGEGFRRASDAMYQTKALNKTIQEFCTFYHSLG